MSRLPSLFRFAGGLLVLATLLSGCEIPLRAEASVLVVSPSLDQSDRILETLGRLRPAPDLQRVLLDFGPSNELLRAPGDDAPVGFGQARLVILENAPLAALRDVRVGNASLLDALPGWIDSGGHLLIVGGLPSYGSYGAALEPWLPVSPRKEPAEDSFRMRRRRKVSGAGSNGLYVDHVHPVDGAGGQVRMKAGGLPLVVESRRGRGRVIAVLAGIHASYLPDGSRDENEFFSSADWSSFLADAVEAATGRPRTLAPRSAPIGETLALRRGSTVRLGRWFEGPKRGEVTVRLGDRVVQRAELEAGGMFRLSDRLRPGFYELSLPSGKPRTRRVFVGEPSDPDGFDIRFFMLGIERSPYGAAPDESFSLATRLREAGFTSTVYSARLGRRREAIRSLSEISQAGLGIVYYRSLYRHEGPFPKWPFAGDEPAHARDPKGKEMAWDVHDPVFRAGMDALLEDRLEDLAVPGLRALQLIEEFPDGSMSSPSQRSAFRSAGLTGQEAPGDPAWLALSGLRSDETARTFQHYRAVGRRLTGDLPQSTYWAGSYWFRPAAYNYRVPALAAAVDELLGPGYGYGSVDPDIGWLSVVNSAADIFAAHGHSRPAGRGASIYAQGRPRVRSREPVGPSVWQDTAWTALAHGANGLAYFDVLIGPQLLELADFHAEMKRVGPWIAAAQRRPAPVAVLASWTTRNAGSEVVTKSHATCLDVIQGALARGFEEVDFLLEEQLGDPPPGLRAIVLTSVPVLSDESIERLHRFARSGGLLLAEPGAGSRREDGSLRQRPWRALRDSGRLKILPTELRCPAARSGPAKAAPRWRDFLAGVGVTPASATPGLHSEARLLGNDEIRAWIVINHERAPAQVEARARVPADGTTWLDLRSGSRVPFPPGSQLSLAQTLPARGVVALLGVRRPAASLELRVEPRFHQLVVTAAARDAEGQPVADGYPVELRVVDASGSDRLRAASRSRAMSGGAARWEIPIPLGTGVEQWQVHLEEPFAGQRASQDVELPAASE